jgi:hypothetical protein
MTAGRHPLDAGHFPQLADFAAGYLHQEYVIEHASPEGARDAFLSAADAGERSRFAAEAARFLDAAAASPWDEVRHAWDKLGGAWTPPDRRALERLLGGNRPDETSRSR